MARPPQPTLIYSAIAAISWPLLRFAYRYRARGAENLPQEGGYVLAAGHVSNFDPWPLGMAIWPKRFLRFMSQSELFWFPLSLITNGAGAFKVHRGRADREAIATAVKLAREGNVIAMFPEGTRRRKGMRKKFEAHAHTGAARIALEAGVPLVPAGIKGTDGLAKLEQLKVAYGAPIPLDDLQGLEQAEAARIATERLMEQIRVLEESL